MHDAERVMTKQQQARGWRGPVAGLLLLCCLSLAPPVSAQTEEPPELGELEAGATLSAQEAQRLLVEALPEDGAARYALLQRQLRAAQTLEDRPRQIELARQLIEAGRGRPGGEGWIRVYLSSEFTWGSSGAALQASGPCTLR
eukprot:Opistho-1_new@93477